MNQHALLSGSRYELLVKIATGGTATVYVGRVSGSVDFQRLVAIKRAHPHLRDDPEARTMLVREARLASRIHHANVVAIHDVEQTEHELLLVMDYIEGGTLAELLERAHDERKRIDTSVVMRILLDACSGLEAVHGLCDDDDGRRLGMVHRDVSPQNILCGVDGTARLTDFGLAKLTEVSASSTAGMQGKIAYMAPEYVEGAPFSQRCDVFSLAVVAWEALSGRRLFKGSNEADTLRRIVSHQPPPLSSVAPTLPKALDTVVARALSKDPAARFDSMSAFTAAFSQAARSIRPASHAAVGRTVRALVGRALSDRRTVLRALADPEHTASMLFSDLPIDLPGEATSEPPRTSEPPAPRAPAETVPLSATTLELADTELFPDPLADLEAPTLRQERPARASQPPPMSSLGWLPLMLAFGAIGAIVGYIALQEESTYLQSIALDPPTFAPEPEPEPEPAASAEPTASVAPSVEPSVKPSVTPRVASARRPPAPPAKPQPPALPKNPYKDRLD